MPLGVVAEGIFQLIVDFVSDIIFEILVKGSGYIILRYIFQMGRRKELDPDSAGVIITGIIFWMLLGFGVFMIWKYL